jgi:hypothetical protein
MMIVGARDAGVALGHDDPLAGRGGRAQKISVERHMLSGIIVYAT